MYYDKKEQIRFIENKIHTLDLQLRNADLDKNNKQYALEQIDMYESILTELNKSKSDK